MRPVLFDVFGFPVPTHEFFVGLGLAVGTAVFITMARRRGAVTEQHVWIVVGEPPAALRSRTKDRSRLDDPLRSCIFATIVLIAWLITPPLALVLFAGVGAVAYVRAYRKGVLRSRCYLRDTRLVIAYLALLTTTGIVVTAWRVVA